MTRAGLPGLVGLLIAASALAGPLGAEADAVPAFAERWSGGAFLAGSEAAEAISLRLFPGGGLMDLPSRGLFGFPVLDLETDEDSISFSVGGEASSMLFWKARRVEAGDARTPRLEGIIVAGDAEAGRFHLERDAAGEGPELPWELDTGSGRLRGSLLLPDGTGEGDHHVLLVLIPGGGNLDRDGNNPAVPGRNDAMRELAFALRGQGVATLRWDQRGMGESRPLAPREEDLVLADLVNDARRAIGWAAEDGRFSSIAMAGFGEGALIGAGALLAAFRGSTEGDLAVLETSLLRGLAVVNAEAGGPREALAESLAGWSDAALAADHARAATAAFDAIEAGEDPGMLPSGLEGFFRPAIRPWLASRLRMDLLELLGRLPLPLLLARGGMDRVTRPADLEAISSVRTDALAFTIRGMNGALKLVSGDPDEDLRAYSDPSCPLAGDLVALLAAFSLDE